MRVFEEDAGRAAEIVTGDAVVLRGIMDEASG